MHDSGRGEKVKDEMAEPSVTAAAETAVKSVENNDRRVGATATRRRSQSSVSWTGQQQQQRQPGVLAPPTTRDFRIASATRNTVTLSRSNVSGRFRPMRIARRTLGTILLLVTVFLWTLSNFLASYMFSDQTYSKPFFVVYVNTSIFAVSLIPMAILYMLKNGATVTRKRILEMWQECLRLGRVLRGIKALKSSQGGEGDAADERLLVDDEPSLEAIDLPSARTATSTGSNAQLNLGQTAWLSLEFCILWFLANYFASACLEHTSVGSVTILTSTSSAWTLVFGVLTRVEGFTVRKLLGVVASLAGVVLISSIDLSGSNDDNRGKFPHKTTTQVAIGDAMAFLSAIVYGVYVTVMKSRVGNEERVHMPLFFGLVGLFNVLLLWPGFFILHLTGTERFELPPTGKVWGLIMLNSISSFISDMSWAYAMLLTTPLIVTVGLSLTIPLSLVGEMVQYAQYSSWVYWIGAGIVLVSFLFVNHDSAEDGGDGSRKTDSSRPPVVDDHGTPDV